MLCTSVGKQLENVIVCSEQTRNQILLSLKNLHLDEKEIHLIDVESVRHCTQQSHSNGRQLIGRILPRYKSKVHMASLFLCQNESSSCELENEREEIVCEICSSDYKSEELEDMFNMSYLNHWFLFYDWKFVPSRNIMSYKPTPKNFPHRSKFSYLEINVDRNKAKCLLKINSDSIFSHIPFFPTCQDLLNTHTATNREIRTCTLLGKVIAMTPLFSDCNGESSNNIIQFMIRAELQQLPAYTQNNDKELLIEKEFIIYFSTKIHPVHICFRNFISIGRVYLFYGLSKARIESKDKTRSMNSNRSPQFYVASTQTYFFPIVLSNGYKESNPSGIISPGASSIITSSTNYQGELETSKASCNLDSIDVKEFEHMK
jgi:hypothetical protein